MENSNVEACSILNMLYANVVQLNTRTNYYICYDNNIAEQQLYYGTTNLTDGFLIKYMTHGKNHLEYLTSLHTFIVRNKCNSDIIYETVGVSDRVSKKNIYDDKYSVLQLRMLDNSLTVVIVTNTGKYSNLVFAIDNVRNCKWDYRRYNSTHIIIEDEQGRFIDSDDIIRDFYRKRKKKACV